MHITPSIIVFTLFGTFLIVRSFRGRHIACDPVCANCGYDLRGYSALTRCSECGRDLTVQGAVQKEAFRASGRQMLVGVGLVLAPWLFAGVMVLLNSLGPNWERVRSNSSIIALLGTRDDTGPWLWDELARRLRSGQLKNPEAADAVEKFIATQIRYNQPLAWSGGFFAAAQGTGVITAPQYLKIAQQFYGKSPQIRWSSSIPSETPTQVTIMPGSFWYLPNVHPVFMVQQISMSGASAMDEDIRNRSGQGSMLPPDINLMSPTGFVTSAAMVPSGSYMAKFVIRTDLLAGNGQAANTWNAPPTSPSLAQWTETVTMPVEVYRSQYSQHAKRLTLRSDGKADPVKAGALSVKSAEALSYADKTIIIITLKIDRPPINCCVDRTIDIGGHQYPCGLRLYSPNWQDCEDVFGCELGTLDPQVTTVTVECFPDIGFATDNWLEQIWDQPIIFKNIVLKRKYYQFDSTGRPHTPPVRNGAGN